VKHAGVGGGVCEQREQEEIEKIFFLIPTPHPVKSSVLRWHPVLSRSYLGVQRSNKNARK